jgi:hypothetical protein
MTGKVDLMSLSNDWKDSDGEFYDTIIRNPQLKLRKTWSPSPSVTKRTPIRGDSTNPKIWHQKELYYKMEKEKPKQHFLIDLVKIKHKMSKTL